MVVGRSTVTATTATTATTAAGPTTTATANATATTTVATTAATAITTANATATATAATTTAAATATATAAFITTTTAAATTTTTTSAATTASVTATAAATGTTPAATTTTAITATSALLEYGSNAEAWGAFTPALCMCHMHLLMHHCSSTDIIVPLFLSLWSTPCAMQAMHQKCVADGPVVISLFIISSFYDLNNTIVDQFRLLSPTSCFHIDDSLSLAQAIIWDEPIALTQVLEDMEEDVEEAQEVALSLLPLVVK